MNVRIEIIPASEQRYPTVGDWTFEENDTLVIKVSRLSDWRREMLVALHELAEVVMCRHAGITQFQVDEFDMAFEKNRPPDDTSEPGDHPNAPYRRQHGIATGLERVLAAEMEIDWNDYERELNETD